MSDTALSAARRTTAALRASGGDGWVVLSACCFATIPIFGIWGYRAGAGWLPLMAWRFTIAVTFLWLLLFTTRRARRLAGKRILGLLGLGCAYAVMTAAYFEALHHAPVSTLTLIFYTYPVLVALLASVTLRESLTRTKVVALALTLAGCTLVLHPERVGDRYGMVLAFATSVIYSVYLLLGTRLTRDVDPWMVATWILTASGLVFVTAALWRGELRATPSLGVVGPAVGLALIATVLADLSLFTGLSRTGAGRAAILSTVEPLVVLLLSAVLLGESIPPLRLLGGGLVLGGVLLVHGRQDS